MLAEEAKRFHAALIHYSTDYVFDGKKGVPYVETDTPNPLNVYGASKLAGEQAIQSVDGAYLILRTAWVYSLRRDSFVSKVLQWARTKETLRIVDDQISNPTWARMLAEATASLFVEGRSDFYDFIKAQAGIYHLAGKGSVSRLRMGTSHPPLRYTSSNAAHQKVGASLKFGISNNCSPPFIFCSKL